MTVAAVCSAVLLMLAGCATQGDLDALKQEMQRSNAAQLEALKAQARSEVEANKKQLDERERRMAADLKALQDVLGKLSDELKANQARMAELARQNQALEASTQATNRAMVEFFRQQETQLKEQLRQVQASIKAVAPAEPPSHEQTEPAARAEKKPPAEKADRGR
jgi:CHAD domain-containing protein